VRFRSVRDLADADLSLIIRGDKAGIPGIGPDMLKKFQARAQLQTRKNSRPYMTGDVQLPSPRFELFFDIETDPMRDVCYLHGFVERKAGKTDTEKYVAFFAEEATQSAERETFANAWEYLRKSDPSAIYFYSPYERTIWRKLGSRYPDVATETDVQELFASKVAVDLYLEVVRSKTEWPTRDFSVKTLASYLGFKWRDTDPSGAASSEWFYRWVETGDAKIKQRILDYNEDDCKAMRVLVDTIRVMVSKEEAIF
jgi:predicted RecB family nuclease